MLLALLALAAPLPAFAISDQAFQPVTASPGPAAISVSTSLDSCGVLEDGVVCKIDVSFNSVPNADSYSATVTRADGSVIDYGGVGAGGTSLWVPYVGSGNYSVRITAYGEPESPKDPDGRGDVLATGYSRSGDKDKPDKDPETTRDHATETATEITGRDPGTAPENAAADGTATSEVGASAAATSTCAPAEPPPPPPTPPIEPPEDLDPANLDEDADGIPDEQERITYEQQMAEYQAALAAQTPAPAPPC